MKGRVLVGAAALVLSACASLPPSTPADPALAEQAWSMQRARNEGILAFELKGRVAGGTQAVKADLRWQQAADGGFSLRLSGPFGAGAILLSGRLDQVTVRTREGSFVTDDPEGWLAGNLGLRLPLAALRYWVLGLPSPATTARFDLAADGSLQLLEQDGWTLSYAEYADSAGYHLPRLIEAVSGDQRLRVLADQWSGLP